MRVTAGMLIFLAATLAAPATGQDVPPGDLLILGGSL